MNRKGQLKTELQSWIDIECKFKNHVVDRILDLKKHDAYLLVHSYKFVSLVQVRDGRVKLVNKLIEVDFDANGGLSYSPELNLIVIGNCQYIRAFQLKFG